MDSILYISARCGQGGREPCNPKICRRHLRMVPYENEDHASPPGSMHLFKVMSVKVPLSLQVMLYVEMSALSSK